MTFPFLPPQFPQSFNAFSLTPPKPTSPTIAFSLSRRLFWLPSLDFPTPSFWSSSKPPPFLPPFLFFLLLAYSSKIFIDLRSFYLVLPTSFFSLPRGPPQTPPPTTFSFPLVSDFVQSPFWHTFQAKTSTKSGCLPLHFF